jgi:Holliday junction resolvase RusA-like endonuclease
MVLIPLRPLSKPRPRVVRNHTYMPAAYVHWLAAMRTALHAYVATRANPDMRNTQPAYPLTTPCALTLHLQLKPRGGHPPDADNLAGGFMDAANGILYKDDAQVSLLGAYKARNPADSISFDAISLDRAHIPQLRAAWLALLDAAIADMPECTPL